MDSQLREFIQAHAKDDVNTLALKKKSYPHISNEDMIFALQQIEGRQKAEKKIPAFHSNPDIIYPVRLSLEQCSSQLTAQHKAFIISKIVNRANSLTDTFADLTAGFGVDTFFLSRLFRQAHYVELNADLCTIARHNFHALNALNISVHNLSATAFLETTSHLDWLFIDPARRSDSGVKVFRLEDCQPNMLDLWETIRLKSQHQMVKLSPMIDLRNVISALQPQEVHVVAVENECKEIIAVCGEEICTANNLNIYATNLHTNGSNDTFCFTPRQEQEAQVNIAQQIKKYVYEPDAAIMKAGAYRLVSAHYQIDKLSSNTHLYTSDYLIDDFQGRIFEVVGTDLKSITRGYANIITRNYPLSAPQLQTQMRKRYGIKEGGIKNGGTEYIIGTTLLNKPMILHATRLK